MIGHIISAYVASIPSSILTHVDVEDSHALLHYNLDIAPIRASAQSEGSRSLCLLTFRKNLQLEIVCIDFVSGLISCTAGSWQFNPNTREAD